MSRKRYYYQKLPSHPKPKLQKVIMAYILLIILALVCIFYTKTRILSIDINGLLRSKMPSGYYLVDTPGCKISFTIPFNSEIKHLIKQPDEIICRWYNPPLVGSNSNSIFIIESSIHRYTENPSKLRCYYRAFYRAEPQGNEADLKITTQDSITFFEKSAEISDEFVEVFCQDVGDKNSYYYYDYFAFIPIKESIKADSKLNPNKNLNIIILGIDGVSRMNLYRQMPLTTDYLLEKYAIDFEGYSRVGENSFPNIMPMLTGLSSEELKRNYLDIPENIEHRFDNCPLIWKEFKKRGFVSATAEDAFPLSTFKYSNLKGFKKQSTDYAWSYFNYNALLRNGNANTPNYAQCIGSRKSYQMLLNYTRDFIIKMTDHQLPYFFFQWSTTLSHDYLNMPKLGDIDYYNFIKFLHEHGYLNNTVLMFVSDHGYRYGEISKTTQGALERNLPFLMALFPEWFLRKHKFAYMRMIRNTKRLTTHYDLYETLVDLQKPFEMTKKVLANRTRNHQQVGYSLFDDIPITRTCEDAGIPEQYCTCSK